MLIRKSMHRKNNLPISSPSHNILDENPFKSEMPATWTRKTEALTYGAQFQCITVEIKERIKHTNRQSDLRPNLRPTVIPQTSPKGTSH